MLSAAAVDQSIDAADVDPPPLTLTAEILLKAEPFLIKEWTMDWQNDLDAAFRTSAIPADLTTLIDFDKFIEDILVGNIFSRIIGIVHSP